MKFSELSEAQVEALSQADPQLLKELYTEHQQNLNQSFNDDGSRNINVADSMHPNIGVWDRFVAKNLGSNPDAQLGYLKKNYPGMEFEKLANGEIVARNSDEVDWKRLDEKGFGLQDLTDVTMDIGQGVAEGVGGIAAGVATANPLVGLGAAGGIGWASELAKQGLGEMAGIDNNFDSNNRAISGVASMAMPAVGKHVVKPAWGMVKKAAPYVGEFMSGIDKDILKNINMDDAARTAIQKMGVDKYSQGISDRVKAGFANARNKSGKAIGDNLSDGPINITPIKQQFNNALNNLTPERQSGVANVAGYLNRRGDELNPRDAISLKNDLYGLAEGDKTPLGYGSGSSTTGDMNADEMGLAKDASLGLRGLLRNSSKDPVLYDDMAAKHHDLINTSGDKRLRGLNDKLGTQKYLESWNKNTTKGTDDINDTLVAKVNQYTGENLDDAARQYQSWQLFQDPKWLNPNKTRGAAAGGAIGGALGFGLGRTWQAGTVGAGIGAGLGNVTSSPWALKKYGEMGVGLDKFGNLIEKGMYANPYIRTDKALINMSRDNN